MSSLVRPRPGERDARQRWATPDWLVRGIERWSGVRVWLDVCAERWSAKAPDWIGPGSPLGEDGLAVAEWLRPSAACWCNPPFSAIEPWVQRARREVQRAAELGTTGQRTGLWLLVPPRTWCSWYSALRLMERARHAHRTTLDGGRISFEPPAGVATSSPMGSCELWWVSHGRRVLPEVVSLRDLRSGMMRSEAERRRRITLKEEMS